MNELRNYDGQTREEALEALRSGLEGKEPAKDHPMRITTKEHRTSDVHTLCIRSKKELAREIIRLQGLLLYAQRMNNNLINGILAAQVKE